MVSEDLNHRYRVSAAYVEEHVGDLAAAHNRMVAVCRAAGMSQHELKLCSASMHVVAISLLMRMELASAIEQQKDKERN